MATIFHFEDKNHLKLIGLLLIEFEHFNWHACLEKIHGISKGMSHRANLWDANVHLTNKKVIKCNSGVRNSIELHFTQIQIPTAYLTAHNHGPKVETFIHILRKISVSSRLVQHNWNNPLNHLKMDTIHWICAANAGISLLLGLSLNCFLAFLIRRRSSPAIKLYSYILMQTCITDIVHLFVSELSQPVGGEFNLFYFRF